MSVVQIQRDPFARATLVRTTTLGGGACRWCGQPGRFYYGWLTDGLSAHVNYTGPFCSVGCYRIHAD